MDVINILSLLDMGEGGREEKREGERKEREEGEKVPFIPDNLPNALAYSALSWPHLCSLLTLV